MNQDKPKEKSTLLGCLIAILLLIAFWAVVIVYGIIPLFKWLSSE